MVVFGGYDHYRPTMTHLLHGLLEERHAALVAFFLGVTHGFVFKITTLLGRKGRYEEGERHEVRQWYGARVGEEAVALVTMALTHDHDVLSGTKHPTPHRTGPPTVTTTYPHSPTHPPTPPSPHRPTTPPPHPPTTPPPHHRFTYRIVCSP